MCYRLIELAIMQVSGPLVSPTASTVRMAEVLLVGASGSGKWALQAALAAHPGSVSHVARTGDVLPWKIDNKYYSVDTVVRVVTPQHDHAGDLIPPEALVLVINATRADTLAAVKAWHAKNSCDESGVRLVVATHVDHLVPEQGQGQEEVEATRPEWLQQAIDWCAEQQFEYIECCCTDTVLDTRLMLFGDPQGVGRVVTALHAHMWPGLTRKPHPSATATTATSQLDTSDSRDEIQQQQPHQTQQHEQTPPTVNVSGPATPDISQQIHTTNGTSGAVNGTVNKPKVSQGSDDDEVDDQKLDAYERLMEEMAAAKHQLAGLDDKTRRARAADLAMQFATLLGMDSDDEGGGTSDDAE